MPSITRNRSRWAISAPRARYPIFECGCYLFTVTETFNVQSLGIVLLPGLRPVGHEHFRVGDPLRLRRPDGSKDLVPIGALEFLKPLSGKCQLVVMLLGKEKEYVPIGTEV
jgi:hypothetical protein